jgi:bacteriorhodopsin
MIGAAGKAGLWIAFGCMLLPCLWFYHKAQCRPAGQRKFEYLCFTINLIASMAYLCMACDFGWTIVNGSQFFYARYVDWTLTTPLMLLDLILLAHGDNADTETICHILSIDIFMVVGGLIGAFMCPDTRAWAFFAFSMCLFLPIFYYLLVDPEFKAKIQDQNQGVYGMAAMLTAIFWTGYPIVWILAEGTSSISLDTGIIFYLILDTISKSVWGIIITMGRASSESGEHAAINMHHDGHGSTGNA